MTARRRPLEPRDDPQTSLPMPVQCVHSVPETIHEIVKALRFRGYKVYRNGAYHHVNNTRLNDAELMLMFSALDFV